MSYKFADSLLYDIYHCLQNKGSVTAVKHLLPFDKQIKKQKQIVIEFNLLNPNVNYSGRTALLTSKVAFYIFIQQI